MIASTGSECAFSIARAFEPGTYRTLRRGRMDIGKPLASSISMRHVAPEQHD
jgi:hypothetical protein